MSYVEDVLNGLQNGDDFVELTALAGLWWRADLQRFLVNCNDWFYWGTADAERLEPEDIPAFCEAVREVAELEDDKWGPLLWACRKRGMRPQSPWWTRTNSNTGIPEILLALFLATGPERSRRDEG